MKTFINIIGFLVSMITTLVSICNLDKSEKIHDLCVIGAIVSVSVCAVCYWNLKEITEKENELSNIE